MGCCAAKKDMKGDDEAIKKRVKEIFAKYDTSHRGYFFRDEFKDVLRDVLNSGGTPVREEYLEKLVKQMDTNHNDHIEKQELFYFLKKLNDDKTVKKGQ